MKEKTPKTLIFTSFQDDQPLYNLFPYNEEKPRVKPKHGFYMSFRPSETQFNKEVLNEDLALGRSSGPAGKFPRKGKPGYPPTIPISNGQKYLEL